MPDRIRKHRSKIAVAVVAAVLVLGLVRVEQGGGEDPSDDVRKNARRVHCLSPKQRPELVHTAIRLGEAAPGSTETAFRPIRNGRAGTPTALDKWSLDSREAFGNVCKPLAVLTGSKALQDPPPKPPLWRRIGTNPLFTLIIGALLTLATAMLTARTARHQMLADQLNTAAAEYLKASDGVRRARFRGGLLDENALEERRVELWSAVLRVPLPPTQSRGLLRRLDRAHRALKVDEFDNERTIAELHELSSELAAAVRGEVVTAGEDIEAAANTSGGGR
ncbi:hypothetical protein [Actinomadura sp. 7K507]|uniref:hypothetical protein n=1 Tax=Actinomadura sp. 7K507 TaxID=2530365 RepID=UPI001052B229|nr:hypothetical protein [Actinomadura sp. 7K507]TDC82170.1 hypothetical protein E1285_31265 [Actinomadura sp. 7K507]